MLKAETKISENNGVNICFYAAPYGLIPEYLAETYPLSQYEIATPLDNETILFTASKVVEYIRKSGHNRLILYRTIGDLDEAIENAVMKACETLPIQLFSIWNSEPWNIDAYKTLTEALNTKGLPLK